MAKKKPLLTPRPKKTGRGRPIRRISILLAMWMETIENRHTPATVKAYGTQVKLRLLPAFGKLAIGSLTAPIVRRAMESWGSQPSAANAARAVLGSFCGWCRDGDIIHTDPTATSRRYKPKQRIPLLSDQQWQALLDTLSLPRRGPMADQDAKAQKLLLFILLTGARRTEARTISPHNIDTTTFEAVVDAKHGRRCIAIPKPAWLMVGPLLHVCGADEAIWGLTDRQLTSSWHRLRKAAGLPRLRVHDLRHLAASEALRGGANIRKIGAMLGHGSPANTDIYAHLTGGEAQETAAIAAAHILDRRK